MKFIDKSILCQTFINFEALYQFLGIFKNHAINFQFIVSLYAQQEY